LLDAGARGYLLKNTNKEELLQATKSVYHGGTYYCRSTSDKLTSLLTKSSINPFKKKSLNALTIREKEIVVLICRQYCNKEIADALKLKVRTIESYREQIQEKIDSRNVAGIVLYAIKTGLFKLEE